MFCGPRALFRLRCSRAVGPGGGSPTKLGGGWDLACPPAAVPDQVACQDALARGRLCSRAYQEAGDERGRDAPLPGLEARACRRAAVAAGRPQAAPPPGLREHGTACWGFHAASNHCEPCPQGSGLRPRQDPPALEQEGGRPAGSRRAPLCPQPPCVLGQRHARPGYDHLTPAGSRKQGVDEVRQEWVAACWQVARRPRPARSSTEIAVAVYVGEERGGILVAQTSTAINVLNFS